MKKLLSVLLILLANFAVLVHAVVPHHHHCKAFTRIVSVLDGDAKRLLTHTHGVGSEHHGREVMEEYFIGTHTFIFCEEGLDLDYHADTAACEPADPAPVPECPESSGFILKRFIAGVHSSSPASPTGLRAPPASQS